MRNRRRLRDEKITAKICTYRTRHAADLLARLA
jgi:hypothetical protein